MTANATPADRKVMLDALEERFEQIDARYSLAYASFDGSDDGVEAEYLQRAEFKLSVARDSLEVMADGITTLSDDDFEDEVQNASHFMDFADSYVCSYEDEVFEPETSAVAAQNASVSIDPTHNASA